MILVQKPNQDRARRSIIQHMWSWIVIGVCYVLVIGGFRILGGIGAAGDALRDWGRASSNGTHEPRPSS
jgi:Sec-independent protein translocase protein TatA